jgi:hypothetical protein
LSASSATRLVGKLGQDGHRGRDTAVPWRTCSSPGGHRQHRPRGRPDRRQLTRGADGATSRACGSFHVLIRRSRSVEPITVRPSPSAPSRAVPVWRAAARGVPAGVMTSGPTASDPTSSVPLPPAVTNVTGPLDSASRHCNNMDSRIREGQGKRTIRRRANYAHRYKRSKTSEHYSSHPNLPRAELGHIRRCCRCARQRGHHSQASLLT